MPPLSGKKPSQMKTTRWSMVYWLTEGRTRADFDALVQNMPTDWHIEGQVEQGETSDGKLHLQLYLVTPQTRGSKIIKFFPSATIDEARNQFALQNYVHKTDTRVAEFKTIENRSPQWSIVSDKFFDWVLREKTDNGFFGVPDEERLKLWDTFIGLSIREGMRIDVIGVNPQYRSCITRYWSDYIEFAKTRASVDKCLDKDKDKTEDAAEVQIPTLAEGGVPRVKKLVKVFLPKE